MELATACEPTATQREQWRVESQVFQIYDLFSSVPRSAQSIMSELQVDKHIGYLKKGLRQLGPSFCVLDANRPWLCYWIIHSIALMGVSIDAELKINIVDFLKRCQDFGGGYGGGPGQMPHLATTYAAVNSLVTLGEDTSFLSINRCNLHKFLCRMKVANGAFRMHDGGEIDVRACYTAISVASLLNILDFELVKNVGNYILSCQTYEGGIGGEPGSEAHGGYTYCGLATMILIDEVGRLDLARLIDWLVFRQGVECGFQGRTNKLVDGCYSFWQGGACALLQKLGAIVNNQFVPDAGGDSRIDRTVTVTPSNSLEGVHNLEGISSQVGLSHIGSGVDFCRIGYNFIHQPTKLEPLFQNMALQQYILLCSQVPEGGFKDKPGKQRDFYHTCYCLSGLSVCQYSTGKDATSSPPSPRAVFGPCSNLLQRVHLLYNVVFHQYHKAHEFFRKL